MRITIIGYSVVLLFDITIMYNFIEALSTDSEEVVRRLNILSGGLYSRNDNLHMEKSNIINPKFTSHQYRNIKLTLMKGDKVVKIHKKGRNCFLFLNMIWHC